VLACIVPPPRVTFKSDFFEHQPPHDHHDQHPQRPREGRATAMMAPVLIMGAIMMFVFWDTSDRH